MVERVSSGSVRLDKILGGGLVEHAITLVVGTPGTGKTIFAERCVFENATEERPAIYFSTVSEPFDKLLRYGQSLAFFDVARIGSSVFYEDLGEVLDEEGLGGVLDRIDMLVKERRPGMVVIDSFKALKAFASGEADFRRFLHDLSGRFSALAVSTLWVGEYGEIELTQSPEFAVADSVIAFEMRSHAERSTRYVSVRKHRGSDFLSGDHVYRVTEHGLDVFPRLADPIDPAPYATSEKRISTGVPALDEALEDGYWPGSTTLVVGPSGVGKTLMGLHFLYGGGDRSEPGILVTLQENRTQLARILARFGWSIDDPHVTVLSRSPIDISVDELVYDLLGCMDELGAKRVVIDSLGDLEVASPDRQRLREFIYSLVQRCARLGVSLMFTYETAELFRITRLSEFGMSHISDNVVLLRHVQHGTEMKRALAVLKSRASVPSPGIREFHISSNGIVLGGAIELEPSISQ